MLLSHQDIDINYRYGFENPAIYVEISYPKLLKLLPQRLDLNINSKCSSNGPNFLHNHLFLDALGNIESFSLIVGSDKFKDIPDSIIV